MSEGTGSLFIGPDEQPDRYQLTELRGRGGEGELWVGWVTIENQQFPVAVKIIRAQPGLSLDEMRLRVQNQAELLRSLDHPGVVKVREAFLGAAPHPFGEPPTTERFVYLVMNWANGQTLDSWVAANPQRDPLVCARIISRLSAAVEDMHSGRSTGGVAVVHRDIKPSNVLVDGDEVHLVDFGLARLVTGNQATIAGSVNYMSPEVLAGAPPSEAADRFGVGAVAYFLFTGANPDLNDPAAMRARLLSVPGITDSEGFADHLLAMIDRDPLRRPTGLLDWSQALTVGAVSQRFASTSATATTVMTATPGATLPPPPPPSAPSPTAGRSRWWILAVVGVLVAAGAILAGVLLGGDDDPTPSGDASATRTTTTVAATTTSTSTSTSTTTSTTTTSTTTSIPAVNPGDIVSPETVQYLADFRPVDEDDRYEMGLGRVSGAAYTRSVLLRTGCCSAGVISFVEFDLARKYTALDATVGLSDDVPADARVLVQIYGDGNELARHELGLGQPVPVHLDVTNVLRLRFQVTDLTGGSGRATVFGDARITP